MKDLQTITKHRLKKFFAAHMYCFTQDVDEIAEIVKVKPSRIRKWMQSENWSKYVLYWGGVRNTHPNKRERRSLLFAEKRWLKLFETYKIEPVTSINIISL